MLNISPTLAKFTELARTRRVISVHTRLLADHLTAIGLYATLCGTREGTFLLESASEGVWSRYSFVGVHSAATLTECGGKAVWLGRELTGIGDGDPVSVLQQTLTELATPAAQRACERLVVHPGEHQHLPRGGVLSDCRNETVGVEPHLGGHVLLQPHGAIVPARSGPDQPERP